MRRAMVGASAITAWMVFAGLGGCGVGTDCDFGLCAGPTADGSNEAGADSGADVTVDPCSEHPTDPACLDETSAVFVAPTGSDTAAGTKAAPLKTIVAALTKGKSRVYVCEGTYTASVEIKSPVSIFGGLSCAWTPSTTKAKIAPAKGIALRVTKVTESVLLQDIEIVGSADADVAGDSAIAAFVSESTNVRFQGVTLKATAGMAGREGGSRSNYSTAALQGGASNGATAGTGPTCVCLDKTTSSKGGNGASGAGGGISGGSATPDVGTDNTGSSSALNCTPGSVGAKGAANAAGASATAAGVLSAAGWSISVAAINAPNGNPGQGGGGGGARTQSGTQAGGGGACGGCGGAGGVSGDSGGSSFALLSFNSNVTVERGSQATGSGGSGGTGGAGQSGQAGGSAGPGSCDGGAGGNGAGGSGGGGGAGGHSVPIAYVGTEPTLIGATPTPGAKGIGGPGGAPGAGPGNAGTGGSKGPDGKSQEKLQL